MTELRTAVDDYLSIRRSLGFKMERNGRLLPHFVAFVEQAGSDTITTELALAWAKQPPDGHPRWWAERMSLVRGFAKHLQALDPRTEVPPRDLLPGCKRRATPYLYSDTDIVGLMAAARTVRVPLRAHTYETLVGLLAVTGMRVGEAIRLDRDDLDAANGLLIVRDTKFGKSREIPLHPSTLKALDTYARLRNQFCPLPKTTAFFVTATGTRLVYKNIHPVFQRLVRRAGLRRRSPSCRPRPHDLRHTFAVRTLLDWYRSGTEVEGRPAALHLPRALRSRLDLLVPLGRSRVASPGRRAPRARSGTAAMTSLAPTLEAFFTERLVHQRHASPHTVSAYRDSLRLLLAFAHQQTGKAPSQLDLADLGAPLIGDFLEHLESQRHNSVRSRNARLAAVHSLFHFAAFRHPEHAALIQRVLAIPQKRFDRALVSFLTPPEIGALLAAPDRTNWIGRRDHTLLLLAIQTGLRLSELTGLACQDVQLGPGAHVRCHGKGRKERCTPLIVNTAAVLRVWMQERHGQPSDLLLPTRSGHLLSSDAVDHLLSKYVARATQCCPSLRGKHVTLHVLRHTCAMQLLQAGVDTSVIALWLGHEEVETTQIYLNADLALKERALARTTPPDVAPGRYRPSDALLAFLDGL